ncbi:translation initiation factor IF-2-like [Malaclemys terrapin pileata]|uniref:translation initiation factor IF-2-like n=1 Tax=Malaclemys terrapin pileata TaxID=2991368 RepID=UPI0023A8F290|nr:translation initiation factor IF-2-like [Malaclemys terrapin pileata]
MSQWCLPPPAGRPGNCITKLQAGAPRLPSVSCAGRVGVRDAGPGSQAPGPTPSPMGETHCHGCPITGPCCLDVQDTVILLVALILVVEIVLKIVTVICCRLWMLLTGLGGAFVPKAPASPLPDSPIQKPRCPLHDASPISPQDRRPPAWWLPLPWRCPLCRWKAVRLTMDVNLHRDRPQHDYEAPWDPDDTARHRHNAPGPYHNCTCPRASSAPSALPRDASRRKLRPATVSRGTDARPAPGVRFGRASREELSSSGGESQRQRPTKVYIYPVHPETPPASRDPSPRRRELRWKEGTGRPAGAPGRAGSRPPTPQTGQRRSRRRPVAAPSTTKCRSPPCRIGSTGPPRSPRGTETKWAKVGLSPSPSLENKE